MGTQLQRRAKLVVELDRLEHLRSHFSAPQLAALLQCLSFIPNQGKLTSAPLLRAMSLFVYALQAPFLSCSAALLDDDERHLKLSLNFPPSPI